ncbi:MAG: hypothetical protein ABIG61_12950 [Planctomycetota bacterium]
MMNAKKTNLFLLVVVLALAGLWVYEAFGNANGVKGTQSSMQPKFCGAGHNCCNPPFCRKDGYAKSFIIENDANTPLFTVPQGERFVLLRMYTNFLTSQSDPPDCLDYSYPLWQLTIDDESIIDEISVRGEFGPPGFFRDDFPDQSVVVKSGQTLGMNKPQPCGKVHLVILGYFCDE